MAAHTAGLSVRPSSHTLRPEPLHCRWPALQASQASHTRTAAATAPGRTAGAAAAAQASASCCCRSRAHPSLRSRTQRVAAATEQAAVEAARSCPCWSADRRTAGAVGSGCWARQASRTLTVAAAARRRCWLQARPSSHNPRRPAHHAMWEGSVAAARMNCAAAAAAVHWTAAHLAWRSPRQQAVQHPQTAAAVAVQTRGAARC